MCGIAGIIAPNAIQYKEGLQKMTNSIAYRGPDSAAHEFFKNAALGHRRLAIVDLSETGKQPMFSNTGNECIVLNGEIYGYLDLKKKYSSYPYRGTSDTELVLAMYQEKGEKLIEELPGMFAFALWDEKKQELFCARDRFGEKPFYYAFGKNGEFIFGSEIKALLASGLVQPKISKEALYHYLKYGYVSAQQTIFSNISVLPPGCILSYREGKVSTERYYELPKNDNFSISLQEGKREFSRLLEQAVRRQLIADVEVGSFLSGGLDSSTIVAMVNKFSETQTTISYGYSGEASELEFAREIAGKYHANHIEIHEERGDIATDLKNVSRFFDEPFADMSYVPQYKICQAAARHLKVVLAGDVGDELFGGYNFYRVENSLKNHFSYKNILAKAGLKLYGKFRQTSFITQKNIEFENILDFHQNYVRNFLSDDEIKSLGISEQYLQQFTFQPDADSLNDIMRIDMEKYVPGNMLVKSDRMAMANSLEVRTPFLDKDFAEFCITLPDSLKINSEDDKIILRETMANLWTENIRKRHKQGFGASVDNWLKEKNMMNLSEELLHNRDAAVFKLLDFEAVQKLLDGSKKQWNLLQLALWAENHGNYL